MPRHHGSLTAWLAGLQWSCKGHRKWTDIISSGYGTTILSCLQKVFFTVFSTIAMPSVGTKKDQEKGNQINPSETSRATPVITYSTSLPTFPPHLWLKSVLAERASGNSIPCNTCGRADEPWHNRHSGEMTVRFSSHGGCPLPCRCLAALLDASRSYAQHPQPPHRRFWQWEMSPDVARWLLGCGEAKLSLVDNLWHKGSWFLCF